MRKWLAAFCASMMCVCCLALAACGGSSASSAASSGSASSASASSSAADPAQQYVGDWQYAAAEVEGVTVVGDLSAIVDESIDMKLSFKEDKTGSMSYQDESIDFTWEGTASSVTITFETDAASSAEDGLAKGFLDGSNVEMPYANNAIAIETTADDQAMKIFFTKDGKMEGAFEISTAKATPITSESFLVGDWKITGMYMSGASIFGDNDSLEAMAGSTDFSLSFADDGTATFAGSEVSYTVGSDGAAIEESGMSLSLLQQDDYLLLDMSSILNMDMVLAYSK